MVCIQELFLGNQSILHSRFKLYWPTKIDNRKNMWVLTVVRKNTLNNVIIENRKDLVSHSHCIVLHI